MAVGEVGADAVGLPRLHGGERLVQHADRRIPLRPGGAGTVHARLLDLRYTVGQMVQALPTVELGWLPEHQPARNLDAAHQRVQDQRRAAHVERLLVTRRHPARMEDHLGRIRGDLLDERAQLVGGNAGVGLLPFRRRVLDRLAQSVHAGDEAVDEVLVVRLLLQDLVDEGEVQRVVAVRAHLPVAGGLAGGDRGARVDVGAAHPVRHGGHERLGLLDHQRLDDVAAVEHEVLHARVIGDERRDADSVDRARRVVDVAAAGGVVVDVVRRAERLHERPGQVGEGTAAIGERDPAPAEGPDRLLQLLGDVVERLVPGRPPPLAGATLAAADQRRLRPLVVELE